jgi:hypothetical protein
MDIELTKPPDDDHPEGAVEVTSFRDQRVIIYYRHLPEKDLTVVRGVPCTTALRTVIDIAPMLPADNLRRAVEDCLRRRLFTVSEALARTAEDDLVSDVGAILLREELLSRG